MSVRRASLSVLRFAGVLSPVMTALLGVVTFPAATAAIAVGVLATRADESTGQA